MKEIDYNKWAKDLISRRTKPYPVYKYNFKSSKYKYVYNVSIDGNKFWYAKLNYSTTYDNELYCRTEEEAAAFVFKHIKKYMKRLRKSNKKWDNKTHDMHINWEKWLLCYQHWQYPKRICELIIF